MTIKGIEPTATDVYLKGNINELIPNELIKKNINRWTNDKFISHLSKQRVTVNVDGVDVTGFIEPMRNAPSPRIEYYCPFYKENHSHDTVNVSFNILNNLFLYNNYDKVYVLLILIFY